MIKCNVTVCGTISKAAVVRTNNENKAFTAFAVNCVIPARNGINKTVEISVAKDGEEYNRADYTVGKRVEISGVLTFKKRGDNLYSICRLHRSTLPWLQTRIPSRAKCTSVERQVRTSRRRQTRKAGISYSSPHFPRKRSMTASSTFGYAS